jgi:RPA family protein
VTGRELAWRVLAVELRAAMEEERGVGDRAPSYAISPLGARMNRVLVAGTLAPAEPAGRESPGTFWRSRLTDPTGTISVSAGSFQPRAQKELREVSQPTTALVMGKVNLFRGSTGALVASLRAEALRSISEAEYRTYLAEAAIQTWQRLSLVEKARAGGEVSRHDAALAAAGAGPTWIPGIRAAVARYPSFDPAPYREAIRSVSTFLERGASAGPPAPAAPAASDAPSKVPAREFSTPARIGPGAPGVRVSRILPPPRPPPASAEEQAMERRLLEALDALADQSPDGYADMDDLSERVRAQGLDGERMEEVLNRLEETRTIEEPIVGKFRRAEGPPPA